MKTEQLEIGFTKARRRIVRREGSCRSRRNRAQWWFRRMREVVNEALDWAPAPAGRPEQIYLALAKSR